MDRAEKCFFCERTSPASDLVAWFVEDQRRTTHTACWLDAHRGNRLTLGSSADPGQSIEQLRAAEAPRTTLDDIRRELEAEYQAASDAAESPPVAVASDEDARVVERHRSASRSRHRRRRYAGGVLGGIGLTALLAVGYVAVTRGTMPLAAVASSPDISVSNVAGTDRIAITTSAVSRTPDPGPTAAVLALVTELDRQLKALRGDLQALAARLEGADSRIAGMESRVMGVESSVRRLADDLASAAANRAAERSAATARQTASKTVPVAPAPPVPAAVTVADSERWTPARHSPNGDASTSEVRPVAETITSPEPRTAAIPTRELIPSRAGTAAVSDNAPRSSVPPTFGEKLRADWRTIKQGFASAGDELKASMRDLTRRITRE